MSRITLYGFLQYDKTLFDGIVLPTGLDKETLVNEIVKSSGDLYPYHQQPEMLKHNITFWFSRRHFDFERLYKALRADYSPIENYDRTEETNRESVNSGADTKTTTLGTESTSQRSGISSNERGGENTSTRNAQNVTERGVSAYNESGYSNREKETENVNNDTTGNVYSDTDSANYSDTVNNKNSGTDRELLEHGLKTTESESVRVHGNIGVTTSQQMIEAEIELRLKYDVYKMIAYEFEREFLIQIY